MDSTDEISSRRMLTICREVIPTSSRPIKPCSHATFGDFGTTINRRYAHHYRHKTPPLGLDYFLPCTYLSFHVFKEWIRERIESALSSVNFVRGAQFRVYYLQVMFVNQLGRIMRYGPGKEEWEMAGASPAIFILQTTRNPNRKTWDSEVRIGQWSQARSIYALSSNIAVRQYVSFRAIDFARILFLWEVLFPYPSRPSHNAKFSKHMFDSSCWERSCRIHSRPGLIALPNQQTD